MIRLSIDKKKYGDCGDVNCIYVDYKKIVEVMEPGDYIYIDRGLIAVEVIGKQRTHLTTGESGWVKWEG